MRKIFLLKRKLLGRRGIILLGVVLVLVLAGFLGRRYQGVALGRWAEIRSAIEKYVLSPAEVEPFGPESVEITLPEAKEGEDIAQKAPEGEKGEEEGKYVERAEEGEGVTHLARRVLKKYLQENPQPFEVTPEHKVYIEDYMAKKKGEKWLELGEEVEFSEDLIKEALGEAAELTPEQLENLRQYSQLVPSLIY